ncbi:DUF2927 domain-containing protein [Falsirhodobacter halotolerans]|uniref:DUF2927 domain-containing protein n=1 Tax=Falsirhodobacter halotolerans TaxID=1146892 RepID=UPI001FD4AB3E|nr:DUF2927 domain-containing protein [Falsirhodobacter halotolerans]MCJ8140280.1 DUF2927 domain-containing protein [Falsirhodobacter halotolerans]
MMLAACASPAPVAPTPVEPTRPKSRPDLPPVGPPSAMSLALVDYYKGIQSNLLSRGLLRTDGGGADTPFDDRILTETFLRIAMYDEYARGPEGFVAAETPTPLRRWTQPVRVGLLFGPSVTPQAQAIERARIGSYLGRLARVTGHPIGLVDGHANFNIFIVNEDERRAMGSAIAQAAPSLTPTEVAAVQGLPKETYCLVYAGLKPDSTYSGALALIRQEHPTLLRMACLHEEIAQGLGLQNDHPKARPSVFNDDEEFALLTRMDEMMLRILYDPRLRPGMTEAEARPIVQTIAAELLAPAAS